MSRDGQKRREPAKILRRDDSDTTARTLLEMRGISKFYGRLQANDSVDIAVDEGEIHALLGENGAGKSTLIKILCGVHPADAGEIFWRGRSAGISSPAAARSLGIGTVFQHFSLFRALTVAENIALGLPADSFGDRLEGRIDEMSARYGLALEPRRPLHTLSVGEWQRVELVRCLLADPKLLVLDEPTSVLTPQEADLLFETLRRLAAEGRAVLYISHRLREIRDLCHSTTVMRAGRVVSRCDPQAESPESLAEMMIGVKPAQLSRREPVRSGAGGASLSLREINLPASGPFAVALSDVSLEVPAGRIVGIAGIAGNGQAELGEVLGGARAVAAHSVLLAGRPVGDLGAKRRRAMGMLFVPEQRLGHAAVAEMSLWENALLTARQSQKLAAHGMLRPAAAKKFARQVVGRFAVKASGASDRAGNLSGGNLQKFILGREILQDPGMLAVMQPTWGVDAGAAAAIRQALLDLAAQGAAVLVVSQDLDEIFEIADEIAVIGDGRLSAARPVAELDAATVGLLMGGGHGHA